MKWQEHRSSTFCHLNQPNPLGFVFNLWLRVRCFVHFNSKGSCFSSCVCCCWRFSFPMFIFIVVLILRISRWILLVTHIWPISQSVFPDWFFQNVPFWSLPDPFSRFSNLMSIFSWCWPQQPIFWPFFQTGERIVYVHAYFPRRGEEAPPTLVPKAIFEVRKDLTSGKSIRIQSWELKLCGILVGTPYEGLTPLQIEAPGMGFCSE